MNEKYPDVANKLIVRTSLIANRVLGEIDDSVFDKDIASSIKRFCATSINNVINYSNEYNLNREGMEC